MIRRFVIAVTVAVLGAFVATPVQAAEWCMRDPALVFKAPHSKHTFTVYATEGVQGVQNEASLRHAKLEFEAKPGSRKGAVRLRIRSTIPGGNHRSFATVLIVSSEPNGQGTLYGVVMGQSGHPTELIFEFLTQDSTRGP